MRILVLGSNGQLGRCLFDQFRNVEDQVIYMSRLEIDIGNLEDSKRKIVNINPNIIINAAAYTEVDQAENNKIKANLINNLAVTNIAEICLELNCWFIHISTDYVFDGLATEPYQENDPTNPQGIYGVTKLNGEDGIISSGCKYLIIRTSWVFSEYGKNFMKTMLKLGSKLAKINIVGDQFGCPTYSQDIAKAIVLLTKHIDTADLESSIYHYAGDSKCSWYEFSNSIFSEAKKLGYVVPNIILPITTEEYPTLAMRPQYSVLNSKKFEKKFSIKPSNWHEGIRDVLLALDN
tara:strand:- start:2759 stop:3634 length:876 start_codon:yes stop_codon:yes gene_type:complete